MLIRSLGLAAVVLLIGITGFSKLAESNEVSGAPINAELIDGESWNWSFDNSDGLLVLKFWATWCPACLEQMPDFVDMHRELGSCVRIVAVDIAVEDPVEDVRSIAESFNMAMPVIYDENQELRTRYDGIGTPTYVLLNAKDEVVYRTRKHDKQLEDTIVREASC